MDRKQRSAYEALRMVARKEGTSVKQVIRDIDDAILEAYKKKQKENNREALALWHGIPCKGNLPTALELVIYLSEQTYADCANCQMPQ